MRRTTPAFSAAASSSLSLSALVLLAFFLRFHLLSTQSFWNDEGNSARIAERSVRLIVEGAAGDIHPPGYYLGLAGWRALAGESEFALRSFSALAGVVLVALVYRLGRQYFDRPAAAGAAFFAAIHPALIYYSQEARMYSLAATLGAAAFLLMTKWLIASRQSLIAARSHHAPRSTLYASLSTRYALAYVLIAAAGLYTHYSFAFVLAAANLAALGGMAFHRRALFRARAGRWIGMQLAALLLFAPWLPTALRQVTTWPSAREYLPFGAAFSGAARWLLLGPTIDATRAIPGLIGLAGLFLLALRRRGQTVTPLVWLLLPALLTVGLGLFSTVFAKFLISAVPAMCLLLGHGIAQSTHFRPNWKVAADSLSGKSDTGHPSASPFSIRWKVLQSGKTQAIGLLALFCGGLVFLSTGKALTNLYFDPAYARADYRAIARHLETDARPGDSVILDAPNQWEVFTYYHRSGAEVYPMPRARPLDPAGTASELEQITARHGRLFVLWWGDAQADPDHFVESWLNTHAFKAKDEWYGDVRLSVYGVSQPATQIQTHLAAQFGDAIFLDGFSLKINVVSPGDILPLTLFWHSNSNSRLPSYKVFVHLAASDGLLLAQHDGEPVGGLRPTSGWKAGERLTDNHGVLLPADLQPGDYRLVVGLYGLEDGVRLPVFADGKTEDDSLPLEIIRVQ